MFLCGSVKSVMRKDQLDSEKNTKGLQKTRGKQRTTSVLISVGLTET